MKRIFVNISLNFILQNRIAKCVKPKPELLSGNTVRNKNPHGAGLRQTAADTAAVPDDIDAVHQFEFFILKNRANGIVFAFTSIQQCIVICRSGSDTVQCINHLDNIGQNPMRQYE